MRMLAILVLALVPIMAQDLKPKKDMCKNVKRVPPPGLASVFELGGYDHWCVAPEIGGQRSHYGIAVFKVTAIPIKKNKEVGKIKVLDVVYASSKVVCVLAKMRANSMKCTLPTNFKVGNVAYLRQEGRFYGP